MLEFDELVSLAKSGDESAIGQLVQRYEKDVRIVARMNLGPALRSHFDSIDLLQSVHHSILVGLRNEKFDIATPEKLIGLATTIVRRKIARKWRKVKRQQRTGQLSAAEFSDVMLSLTQTDQQGSEASLQEELERLFQRMDEDERRLIALRVEGYSTAEAARELNQDPDVMRVKLSRLRKRIKNMGFFSDWL